MEIVPYIYGDCHGSRHNILDWFKKHKDLAWGSDSIISELQNPKTS